MSAQFQPALDFEAAETAAETGDALILDLDGFEGPLHMLLALARTQKVNLLQISVAALADQYLAFVQQARQKRFALAADYLVMAAWLTYLKSRLLLPKPERRAPDQDSAQDMAAMLTFRLAKLDAMRRAGEDLQALPQKDWDVFTRGAPELARGRADGRPEADLYDLITAYAAQRLKTFTGRYQARARIEAYPLDSARERLRRLAVKLDGWTALARLAPSPNAFGGPTRASYLASTFAAGLEIAKEGELELQQDRSFSELWVRRRLETHEQAVSSPSAALA